jgi:hypothetical protein
MFLVDLKSHRVRFVATWLRPPPALFEQWKLDLVRSCIHTSSWKICNGRSQHKLNKYLLIISSLFVSSSWDKLFLWVQVGFVFLWKVLLKIRFFCDVTLCRRLSFSECLTPADLSKRLLIFVSRHVSHPTGTHFSNLLFLSIHAEGHLD